MTAVECLEKSGPYCCQVCAGALKSAPLTGKNTSLGLRATCATEFTAAQTAISKTVPATIRMGNGATRKARNARLAIRQTAEAERRARRRWLRVLHGAPCEIVAWGMTGYSSSMPGPSASGQFRGHRGRSDASCEHVVEAARIVCPTLCLQVLTGS